MNVIYIIYVFGAEKNKYLHKEFVFFVNLLFDANIIHNEERKMFCLTTHSTFFLRLHGVKLMVKDHTDYERRKRPEREMFYLTTHSTHFIYGYMASDIWLRTILIVRKETRCRHIGYSYRLAARVILYAPSHRQDNTYHGLCYTSRGALAKTARDRQTRSVSSKGGFFYICSNTQTG